MRENDIICGISVYFGLDFNAFFSKISSRKVLSEREKCGDWLDDGWEEAGAKDAPERANNEGNPQGFGLGMSFAEDATFGLKSLNFLQGGQAGEMRGKVAKI